MRIKLLIILALLNLNVFAVEGMWERITIVSKCHIYNLTPPKMRICSKPDLLLEENRKKNLLHLGQVLMSLKALPMLPRLY